MLVPYTVDRVGETNKVCSFQGSFFSCVLQTVCAGVVAYALPLERTVGRLPLPLLVEIHRASPVLSSGQENILDTRMLSIS